MKYRIRLEILVGLFLIIISWILAIGAILYALGQHSERQIVFWIPALIGGLLLSLKKED